MKAIRQRAFGARYGTAGPGSREARAFRSWSDGQRVHLLVRFRGGELGRSPVTMHTTTDLTPARAVARRHLMQGDDVLAGDPVAVEALATRIGAFSALRRLGRAAKGAVSFATAPARALAGAGIASWRTTTNLAKGVESAAALTAYATRPLAWRPGGKGGGSPSPPSQEASPPRSDEGTATDQEEPMTEETSGNPRPQARHVMGAVALLRRARKNPQAARHVQNIAKAAAKGHPGAVLAQAAISEARKQQRQQAAKTVSEPPLALMPSSAARARSGSFPAWSRGAQ